MPGFDIEKLRVRIVDIKEEWKEWSIDCPVNGIDYSAGVIHGCELILKEIDKLCK